MPEYRDGDALDRKPVATGGDDPSARLASAPAAKPSTPQTAPPPSDLDLAIDEIAPTRTMKEGFTGQER